MILLTVACSTDRSSKFPSVSVPRGAPIELIGDIPVYQLFCNEFTDLSLQGKLYAYHLTQACIIGRDIAYDGNMPKGLEIRCLLDHLSGADLDSVFSGKLNDYAERFWMFQGNYDFLTGRKFVPTFTPEEWDIQILEGGWSSDFGPYLLDVNFQSKPKRTSQEVYRAGTPDIPPGRMAETLQDMIGELEEAISYAPDTAREALIELIRYLRTGEPDAWDYHQRLWVEDTVSSVDYAIGFFSPLGEGTSFTGIVTVKTDNGHKILFSTNPICPTEMTLPTDGSLCRQIGSKRFSFANVLEARTDGTGSSGQRAFIMPEIELVRNRMGGIKSLRIAYLGDFRGQMLRYASHHN